MNIQTSLLIFIALQMMLVTYYLAGIYRTMRCTAEKEETLYPYKDYDHTG